MHDMDAVDHALTIRPPSKVNGGINPSCHQGMQGATIQARHQAECLQSSRHVLRRIRMNCPASAFVTCVHRREEVDHFRPPDLADHQSVRTHSQRLPHQIPQGDCPGTFHVRQPRLQSHDMGVVRPELCGVLYQQDAVISWHQPKEAGQDCGLSTTRSSGNQEGQPSSHDGLQPLRSQFVKGTRTHQIVELERPPTRHPERNHRAIDSKGRKHGMKASAIFKAGIDIRHGAIEATSGSRGQPLCESAYLVLISKSHRDPLKAQASVDPYGVGSSHQDISDPWHP